jgi:hypothetical protein
MKKYSIALALFPIVRHIQWENSVTAIRRVVTFCSSFVTASSTPVVGARVGASRYRSVVESLGDGRPLVQIENGYGGTGSSSDQAEQRGDLGNAKPISGAVQGRELSVDGTVDCGRVFGSRRWHRRWEFA